MSGPMSRSEMPVDPDIAMDRAYSVEFLLKKILQRFSRVEALLKTSSESFQNVLSNADSSQFWSMYVGEVEKHASELIDKYKNDMDIVMLFATLFSAIVTAFLVAVQPALSPNPSDTTNALLTILIQKIDNSTFPNQPLAIPQWNGPSYTLVCSQALGYASLSISLSTAIGAVLGKQWINQISRLGTGTDEDRGRRQQQRLDALKTWRFDLVMEALPAFLQLALLLFAIALCMNVRETNQIIGWVLLSVTALGGLVYMAITVLSLSFASCPFHTPVSVFIRTMIMAAIQSIREVSMYWEWRKNLQYPGPPQISIRAKLLFPVAILLVGSASVIPAFMFIAQFIIRQLTIRMCHLIGPSWQIFVHHCERLLLTLVTRRWERTRNRLEKSLLKELPSTSDSRMVAWILEMSNNHELIMAAAVLVPNISWPESVHLSVPTQRLCDIFTHSASEMLTVDQAFRSQRCARTITLGKALVIVLSQNSEYIHRHSWAGVVRVFKRYSGRQMEPELTFLLTLVVNLLPMEDDSVHFGIEHPEIPALFVQSLPWRLIFPRLRVPRHSRAGAWLLPETQQQYYLEACIRYLEISLETWNGSREGSDVQPGDKDWHTIGQILNNLDEWDVSNGCILRITDLLSELLRAYLPPSLNLNHDSVHSWTLKAVTRAVGHPTGSAPGDLADKALRIITTVTTGQAKRWDDPKGLFNYLVERCPELPSDDSRRIYLVKTIGFACDAWLLQNLVFCLHPTPHAQQISAEILCHAISRNEMVRATGRVIDPKLDYDTQILDTVLEYLLLPANETLRTTWRTHLAGYISAVVDRSQGFRGYADSERHLRFIRILCALGPVGDCNKLSFFWKQWTSALDPKDVHKAVSVVEAAHWILTNCQCRHQWYSQLQGDIQGIIRFIWSNWYVFQSHPEQLCPLAVCTVEWLSCPERCCDYKTADTLARAANSLLEGLRIIDLIPVLEKIRKIARTVTGGEPQQEARAQHVLRGEEEKEVVSSMWTQQSSEDSHSFSTMDKEEVLHN